MKATRATYHRDIMKTDSDAPETWTTPAFEVFKHFGPAGSDEAIFKVGSVSSSKKRGRPSAASAASDEGQVIVIDQGDAAAGIRGGAKGTSRDTSRHTQREGEMGRSKDKGIAGAAEAADELTMKLETTNEHVAGFAIEMRKKTAVDRQKVELAAREARVDELKMMIEYADTDEAKKSAIAELTSFIKTPPPTYMSPTKTAAPPVDEDDGNNNN